jgi:hypothetical protein
MVHLFFKHVLDALKKFFFLKCSKQEGKDAKEEKQTYPQKFFIFKFNLKKKS